MRDVIYVQLDIVYSINYQLNETISRISYFFETVKSKVIISLFETVRLSVSISPRNLYNSLKSIKEMYFSLQSGPQDQKSVTFSHSVTSLNQLLKNSKNTANIFLTFRNHVKIFLSQNIMHNFISAVYRKNPSIRTVRTDKTVKTLIRLLLEEQSDLSLHCLSFYLLHLHIILQRKPKLFNFRIFFNTYIRCSDSKSFHLKMFVDSL